ncbi:MAG: 16S rRNA (cytidine(1402)-2'-O)-methyltransferase [Chloroflexaceae bacterium]|nr:16S rRNA (cytidine(1402)-2'-O)-methyltransferase [Chloroflexaceae bacterium]
MGTLYLVSTPIGNLEDMTLRGLRLLREAHLIAAEDTRHTRRLLTHYQITTPCIAYHQHNKYHRLPDVLQALTHGDVALVSDAGTPGLSDPGFELVRACYEHGFAVSPIPGPSAPIAALVASGLPTERFCYLGFLPNRSPQRRAVLTEFGAFPVTLVCFESPHRLLDALRDALDVLGDRHVVVARELTKIHEELLTLSISAAIDHFTEHAPRGEITLVIAPPADDDLADTMLDMETILTTHLEQLMAQGQRASDAVRMVARQHNQPRRAVYALWLRLQETLLADGLLPEGDQDE